MGTQPSQAPAGAIPHQYFCSLSLDRPQNPTALVGRTVLSHAKQLANWQQRHYPPEHHQHVLLPLKHTVVESGLCGGAQTVELQYQPFGTTLEGELKIRATQGKHLEEGQLWYLAWVLVEVAQQTSDQHCRLEDIKPSNVFMNSKGNIKVLTPFSTPQTLQPFLNPAPANTHFSPEELSARREGQMFNETNSNTSQAFAIGMTLLSAGLISPQYDIYNYGSNKLNRSLLEERLARLGEVEYLAEDQGVKYSEMLLDVARRLLEVEEAKRLNRKELYQMLSKNVTSIMQLEPFSLEAPGQPKQSTVVQSPLKQKFTPQPVPPQSVTKQIVIKQQPNPQFKPTIASNRVTFTTHPTHQQLIEFNPPKTILTSSPPALVQASPPKQNSSPPKPFPSTESVSPSKISLSYLPSRPVHNVAFSPSRPGQSKEVVLLKGKKKEEGRVEEVSFGGGKAESAAPMGLNLAESQYVAPGGEVDWLKRIDEQLQRSRQLFSK